MEPVAFLRQCPPFDQLDAEAFAQVEKHLEVEAASRGTVLLRRDGEPSRYLYLVCSGSVRLDRGDRTLELLEAGDFFGYPSILAGRVNFDCVVEEDAVLARLPEAVFRQLLSHGDFAAFFLRGIGERMRRLPNPATDLTPTHDLALPIGGLVDRRLVSIGPEATVGQTAAHMREYRVSCILVDAEERGIVTDRDLRNRVLAEGRGPETPVVEVMSAPLKTLPEEASLLEALLFLSEQGIHHLPVTRDGEIVGVVSDTALLMQYARSPAGLLQRIERNQDLDELEGYAGRVHEIVDGLIATGVPAREIGRVVSTLNDRLLRSLLRTLERDLGPPPVAYAWLVCGPEGRLEQALLTDQDNGLVYADPEPARAEQTAAYFARLAGRALEGLIKAGFPPTASNYVATRWCFPMSGWVERLRSWVDAPSPQGVLDAATLFDMRPVHGTLDVTPLEVVRRSAGDSTGFLAALAHAALADKPPLGLFHSLRDEGGVIDVARGALQPLVGAARVLALAAGSDHRSTFKRLEAAALAGEITDHDAENLAECFEFVSRLLLREQLRFLRSGAAVSNRLPLERLSARERRQLKDTFVAVRELQALLAQRFPYRRGA
jgi:CBS domain-containing protein